MSGYKFYYQTYPVYKWNDKTDSQELVSATSGLVDVEETFKCKYVKFEGLAENGEVKNVYTEEYAESGVLRIYTPTALAYKSKEVTLSLLFPVTTELNEFDIQENERAFYEAVSGKAIEWHDTFRNRYVTLVLLAEPKCSQEVLYGNARFRMVEYTFKNLHGQSFGYSLIERGDKQVVSISLENGEDVMLESLMGSNLSLLAE